MKLRFVPLVLKQIVRQRTRSLLTVLGVASAMFLYGAIQSLQAGVREATEATVEDTTLVVYRENRFCPFTSRLPEDYETRIARVPGVASVTPMKIVVNNCRTSLDVVTYRGVRSARFAATEARSFDIVSGSLQDWLRRSDAALVGKTLADRRGFRVGDRFESSGITVTIAAIFELTEPQHRNVAYVDLDFLQLGPGHHDGIVTQFNVRLEDPTRAEEVSAAIDAEFVHAQEPTQTSTEKSFVARAAADAVELIGFTWWVALGCVGAVLALVANAIVLSVQDRVRDYAVLQTLGYTGGLIGRLVVAEGLLLSLIGGALGTAGAVAFLSLGNFSLSNEGLSISADPGISVLAAGLVMSVVLGVLAGLVPALRAARIPIAASFRAV